MRYLILALWLMLAIAGCSGVAVGYVLGQANADYDHEVWRCVEYVPGAADCQTMVRR
jgi:hypothetical protein